MYKKLVMSKYPSLHEFRKDIDLIASNCLTYNHGDAPVSLMVT